jgi:hypothetical protein
MIPKEQVPPMTLIVNQAIDKTQLPQLGATISGTAKTVAIDDIIAAEGVRIPNAATSPKKFNVGFVLLTRPGTSVGSAPAAIETLLCAWAGKFAELTRGIGGINGVAPSLTVNIDSPSDGATITGPSVTVTGTVINTSGAETGIMVNGQPATISGSKFIANHVQLQEGANNIEIKAVDANGLTSTTTRNVTAQAGHYLRISSNIDSGTGPLDISLRLDGSFVVASPQISVSGPVATSVTQQGTSQTDLTAKLVAEGTYTITVSATGPDGKTYSDNVRVSVVSKAQLETLLQGRWEGMNNKISQGDIVGATQYLRKGYRQYYQELFTVLGSQLPQLADGAPQLEFVYASEERAKCRVFQQEIVLGVPVIVGYPVYFEKEDGVWRLIQY